MAKKKAKPKHAPLKPRTAWAVVHSTTGRIAVSHFSEPLVYPLRRSASKAKLRTEHVQKVRITKA